MQSRDLNLKETHDQHKKRATRFSDDKPTTSEYDIASMKLFVLILDQIFQIEDWGPGVAGLLQPLPFPEEALRNRDFIRSMYPLIERITHDPRDVVVQTLLHLRDGKDGWLQIYSLNSTLCEDDGRLFLSMVTELSRPGVQSGKRKKFLSMLLSSQLQAIITLAVRGSEIMIQLLSEFLELDIVSDKQSQLQIFSAMRCTASGRKVYEELCSRREVNEQMTGPTEFRMSPNSTFHDLEVLLGSGSWGNLERLDLSFMQATQAIVPTISKLRNLKHLDLRFTDFNDEGLKNLCDSNLNLETLNLCETQVTDDGIQHLGVMTKLKYLNLNSTGITAQVFTNLKESLSPDVHYDVTYTDAW
uniref:Uncharacterized protein n=1 Tax=Ciona savignyi TaxID=51511 RepID=H2Z0M0_CIOSA